MTGTVAQMVTAAAGGDQRAVGRLISLVEDGTPTAREVTAAALPLSGRAQVIGITGAPGVGKSTTVGALISDFRATGLKVGVLAVDPSSPFTGGAVLGDRVRMQRHATDEGVFIRSLGSRGRLGGLSRATPQAVRVLDAAGFDVVLVETVGVGQAEVEIAGLADSTVVLLAPGMGDSIQAAKAGLLEVADVFVVNKADRDGAQSTVHDLRGMLELVPVEGWQPPVVSTVAAEGIGIGELVEALGQHHAWLTDTGELGRRRTARARAEIESIVLAALRERTPEGHPDGGLADRVASGELDPYLAADLLLAAVNGTA